LPFSSTGCWFAISSVSIPASASIWWRRSPCLRRCVVASRSALEPEHQSVAHPPPYATCPRPSRRGRRRYDAGRSWGARCRIPPQQERLTSPGASAFSVRDEGDRRFGRENQIVGGFP
jgi:hypothetical protein